MVTKQHGGKITGLLALTAEAQEALNRGDAVHLSGDYEVEKADGTKPILGYISVANKGRVGSVMGTSVGNPLVPGVVTVEARGFMVREVKAGAAVNAGDEVVVGADNKHVAWDDTDPRTAVVGIALTSADDEDDLIDVLVR